MTIDRRSGMTRDEYNSFFEQTACAKLTTRKGGHNQRCTVDDADIDEDFRKSPTAEFEAFGNQVHYGTPDFKPGQGRDLNAPYRTHERSRRSNMAESRYRKGACRKERLDDTQEAN